MNGDAASVRYGVETRWGGSEDEPSVERMKEIIAELATRDEEHPDTWLTHDASGWTIALDEDGIARLSDEGGTIVSHMAGVRPEQGLALWIALARGGQDAIANEAWRPGAPPVDPARQAARIAEAAAATLAMARSFYDSLGAERPDTACRAPGCVRGAIAYSVMCRTHHCEQLWRRPCAFDH